MILYEEKNTENRCQQIYYAANTIYYSLGYEDGICFLGDGGILRDIKVVVTSKTC